MRIVNDDGNDKILKDAMNTETENLTSISRDADDAKDLLSELQRANYLNAILLDSIPHPALLVKKNRQVIAANKLAREAGTLVGGFCWRDFGHCLYISGKEKELYEADSINENSHIACSFCKANSALEKKECVNIEMRLENIDWDIYWVPTQEEGVYLHYAIDITERKKIENRLKESESRFKKLAEASFEGICIHVKGIILDFNERMEAIFGYADEELAGKSISDIIITGSNKAAITSDSLEQTEPGRYLGIKKNGNLFEVEVLTREIQYNGLTAEVLVVRDSSKSRNTEEAIKKINNTMKDAQRIAHIGNIEIDIRDNRMYWSDEIFRIFGYQPQEFSPDASIFERHILKEDMRLVKQKFIERTPQEPTVTLEISIVKLEGKKGWLKVKGDIEFAEHDGKPSRIFIIMQDITDKKQAELIKKVNEENARLLKETLEMDRLKTEFFANVSHELRTPLNIIFGTIQLYEMYLKNNLIKDSENRITKGIKRMKQNCYRLLRLINNLLDITKVDGGYISFKPINADIVKIVKEICISVAEYATNMNIKFTFNTDIYEKNIACDPDKIETIILNLISNAIKFNKPEGSVAVNIHNEEEAVLISVEDNGRGIPDEKKGIIFERFMQVDRSLTRDHEGSGIGLSLVKSFVEMHEGQIWLESQLGKGSKFIFRLPNKRLESEKTNNACTSPRIESNNIIERINIEFSDIYME